MRHGVQKPSEPTSKVCNIPVTEGIKVIEGENLGCYFCTDVTAPGNVNIVLIIISQAVMCYKYFSL